MSDYITCPAPDWFAKKWWRFATGPNDGTTHEDNDGVWIHLFGSTWWLATPSKKVGAS